MTIECFVVAVILGSASLFAAPTGHERPAADLHNGATE
jgi:hypothetical protein